MSHAVQVSDWAVDTLDGKLRAASRALLRSRFDEPAATAFLAALGSMVAADRAYVFENETADGTVSSSQRFEWNGGAADPQIDNPELQNLPLSEMMPRLYETLARGEHYFGVVRELCGAEREHLAEQGILSLLVCPIRIDRELWGFVGFDDCTTERCWSAEERSALSQASIALAASLRHRRVQERLAVARRALEHIVERRPSAQPSL